MELCEGSLNDYLKGTIKTIPKDSLDDKIILGQVCLGLAYIHSKEMVHKDLKPDNILLWQIRSNLVMAKIADFGYAKQLTEGKDTFSDTDNGGTRIFMAPELLQQGEGPYRPSFKSDIYSLGMTIACAVLKGEDPFGKDIVHRLNLMQLGIEPINLKGLDGGVIDLILQLTKYEPEKRPNASIVNFHPYFVLNNEKAEMHFTEAVTTFFESLPSQGLRSMFEVKNVERWVQSIKEQQKEEANENIYRAKKIVSW